MADNCSSIEPWAYRPAFSDTCWISDAFARDTETLTRALTAAVAGNNPPFFVNSEPAITASASDAKAAPPRRIRNPIPSSPSRKISKRKSKASNRSTTTFITADPANFRQMVQLVTGIRFGGAPSEPVLKQEPHRPGSRGTLQQSCLPTLDTSAFLLDRAAASTVGPSKAAHGSYGAAVEGSAFDFEPFFPTLDSWGVM